MLHQSISQHQGYRQEQVLSSVLEEQPTLPMKVSSYVMLEEELLPQRAYQLIHNEILLNTNPRFNFATYRSNRIEPEAEQLMKEALAFNQAGKEEYPFIARIEVRCLNILAHLWHAPDESQGVGCSTPGSSEARMLGGLALKWQWRKRMQAMRWATDRPNLVFGINAQVNWERFCRYFDVEARLVPIEDGRYHLTGDEVVKYCDENTIGVVAMMGCTMDGSYEPVAEISDALDILQEETGLDIPIHVDAASGGLVAPFLQPETAWDFRLHRVKSINVSGHKYGLIYPDLGWILWRDKRALPERLTYSMHTHGNRVSTLSFSFSQPASQILAQYYHFLRLGKKGYQRMHQTSQEVAVYLSEQIQAMGPFQVLTEGRDLPVFAFKLKEPKNFSLFDLSERLRGQGWFVPAYTLPKNLEKMVVMRIVVREGIKNELADYLLKDIQEHLHFYASRH